MFPPGNKRHPARVRGNLTRFIVIVIIAVCIEGLIMFFKLSEKEEMSLLPCAGIVFASAFLLLIGLGIYIEISIPVEKIIGDEKEIQVTIIVMIFLLYKEDI